jgi:O-antigen chain-terminating methyltransferase
VIETTVPEINISKLMEQVRTEATRPKSVSSPPPRPAVTQAALPPIAMLPAAPSVWIPGAVKSRKERLGQIVELARRKNDGGSRLPKFLRRFFRKQGGYNRAVLDGVEALAKSNHDLTQRVADITVCLGQLNSWLLALHEQSDADANWMKAAGPALAKLATLESELALVRNELQSADDTLQEVRRSQARAADRADAVELSTSERIAGVRDAVDQVRREIKGGAAATATAIEQVRADWASVEEQVRKLRSDLDNTATHLRSDLDNTATHLRADLDTTATRVRGDLDHAGVHLRNLQAQADAMRRELDDTGTHLRSLQSQTDEMSRQLAESIALQNGQKDLEPDLEQASLHLRNLQAQTDRLGVHVNNLQGFVEKHTAETSAIHRGMEQRLDDQAGLAQRIASFEERTLSDAALIKGELSEYGSLFRQLLGENLSDRAGGGKKHAVSTNGETKAGPGVDSFYLALENRFRGSRAEIKKRVEFYLPFLRKCRAGTSGRPVLDIGCGRGEWLELLKDHKLDGRGVDMNTAMAAQCKARGLKVELGDALEYLRSLRANTHGAITGFHIIEHLPFEMLLELFRQARRVLKPGGVVIFESPNCKNLIVGACSFHIDPTHRQPVFPETAELMLASQGFEKIRIEYLSPVPDVKFAADTAELGIIRDLLYGPQDFGIIAHKPKGR